MCMVPIAGGKQPVMIALLDGPHTGAAAKACSNSSPSAASASRRGVDACSAPGQIPV